MRIAILTSWYPTVKNPLYGIFVQTQASALSECCEVDVLLMKRGIIPKTKIIRHNNLTIYSKSGFYLPNRNEALLKIWAHQYYLHFKKSHEDRKYDIIHCHDHYGAYAGWYINQRMKIPYVVTIHNSSIQSMRLANWKQSYLPKILNSANQVIAVGHKLKERLEDNFTSQKVEILPNIIDVDIFKPNGRMKLDSPFKFLFIGDFDENKGVIRLLQAFEKMEDKNSHLHIIGRGPLKRQAEEFVKENNLKDRIVIEDHLSNDKLPEVYNSAHVYVSLSLEETFGITVLEAMSCGLPIIYTKSGGPEHIVAEHGCTVTSKTEINQISNTLDTLIRNYQQIERSKIRKHVVDNYSSQSIVNELLLIYKECINEE